MRHLIGAAALALPGGPWQRRAMTISKPPEPRAAGAFIALGLLGGTLAGVFMGQPTIGLLAGFGLGLAIALLVWLKDRRG
ncbi:MAG: hypothetical protein RJB22_67 [Pseudomonadota bacterium]